MSKLWCVCGHVIPDNTDYLSFKGYVLKDQDKEALFTKFTEEVASFATAVQTGTFEEWRQRRPWVSAVNDPSSWWRFFSMVWLQYWVQVYECTQCGRLWVEGDNAQQFIPFVRESPGNPVLPSRFWRGIDQPPVDPDPALTARCGRFPPAGGKG